MIETKRRGERSRLIRITAAAVVAVILTFSAAGRVHADDTVRLAIGYIPHVQFAPLYVGIEKGFYRDAGISLEIQYGFGIDIFSLLATERIDIGLSDSDQLILAGARGLGLKAVLQYYRGYPVTIVAKSGKAAEPEDLAGKTIGTPELYGTSYIGLQIFLKRFGLENRVKVERIGYTQIPSLLADRIDAAVCFRNNEPIQLTAQGVSIDTWDVSEFSDVVGASFISSESTLRKRADVIERFSEATRKAMEYTAENPVEAVKLSLSYLGSVPAGSESFLERVLRETIALFGTRGEFGKLDIGRYRSSITALRELGILDRAVEAENILHIPQ